MGSKVNLTRSMSIALAFPTFWNLLSNSWNRPSENIKWFYLANQDYFQLLPDSCMTLHVLSRTKTYYFICSVFLEVQDNVPGCSWSYQCEILQYQFIYNSSGIAILKHTLIVLEYLFFKINFHFTFILQTWKKFCARPWFDNVSSCQWNWNTSLNNVTD